VYTTSYYYGNLGDSTVNFAGKLGWGTLYLQNGTAGGADAVFNIDSATLASGTGFSVGNYIVLTGSAAKLSGKSVGGSGSVAVSGLHLTLNADLGDINTTTTAAFDGNGEFTGTLGGAVVTVGNNFTMTAAANKVANETVNKTGSGKLAVTLGEADASVDLTTVSGDAFDSVTVIESVNFTGVLDDVLATAVNSGATFTADASVVNGKAMTGSGNVVVTSIGDNTNLANLNASLNVTATVTSNTDISLNSNLSTVDAYDIAADVTLTMTSAQATGKSVTAAGSLVLTDTTIAASLLNSLDSSVAGLINASNATTINGSSSAIKAAIDANDAQLLLRTNFSSTISGAASAADLLAIATANGTGTVNVTSATSITGSAADLVSIINNSAEFAINGAVNLIVSGTASVSQASIVYNASATGTKTFAISDGYSAIAAADNTMLTAASSVTAEGTDVPDTINMATLTRGLIINGFEGDDTIYGSSGNDVINGGDDNDIIFGRGGTDTMTGGAGSDSFAFTAGSTGTISGSVYDIITDYTAGVGGDKLDLAGAATAAANASATDVATASGNAGSAITAAIANGILSVAGNDAALIDSLTEWLAVARAMDTVDTKAVAFEFSGDTYVFQENASGDLLIQLDNVTGITALSTTAAANTLFIA
jgi:hypothetical protein